MSTKVQEAGARIWLSLLDTPWEQGRYEVRAEMGRLGISQDDLAYRLRRDGFRVSSNAVKRWLRGEMSPRYDAVRAIVLVLAAVCAGDSRKASLLSQSRPGYAFGSIHPNQHGPDYGARKRTRQGPRPKKSPRAA